MGREREGGGRKEGNQDDELSKCKREGEKRERERVGGGGQKYKKKNPAVFQRQLRRTQKKIIQYVYKTDRQTNRQIDRQIDRQRERERATERQIGRETVI